MPNKTFLIYFVFHGDNVPCTIKQRDDMEDKRSNTSTTSRDFSVTSCFSPNLMYLVCKILLIEILPVNNLTNLQNRETCVAFCIDENLSFIMH